MLSHSTLKQMHIHDDLIAELQAKDVLTPEGDRFRINYEPAAELRAKVLNTEILEQSARSTVEGAREVMHSLGENLVTGKVAMANNSDDEHPLISHDAEFEAYGFHIENFG